MRDVLMKLTVGVLMLVLTVSAGTLSGCKQVDKHRVWSDMSPEMSSLSRTRDQRTTQKKRAHDTNLRQLNEDWDRIWLNDRPLWLSEYPVP